MHIPPDTKTEGAAPDIQLDGSPEAKSSPPPYATSDPSSSSSTRPFVPPDSVKPSNHLSLSQTHNSFRGIYVIDPSLEIPHEYLPPLPDGETENSRSNFYAKSTHGNVSVDLYLLDKPINKPKRKILLNTSSEHGSVYTTIRRGDKVPSFELNSSSKNGNVIVKIPRSFRGPVTGTTIHGRITMSDDVSAQAMVFSEVHGVKRIFIGDMSTRNEENDDSVILETKHGSVRIYYEDEDSTPPVVKSVKGFWSRIVGL
ncbi:hypothetical protein DFH05DRAFT_1488698 [Lentinula detonsa]|uniref:DUF7330 domain-containing protein n=1 Tax=Lentinula detonsa TaxID=2804962 RepID=A0A9W8P2K4_9AGAR|nr:hypothetical protein DFH05DRAFT_1488698 [Lentinula detonsa]